MICLISMRHCSGWSSNSMCVFVPIRSRGWRWTQNLEAVSDQNHAIAIMIQHLRDIINRSKEDAILLTFDCGLLRWTASKPLPPYDVAVFDILDTDYGFGDSFLSIRTFYSDISFLFTSSEGISAECHGSILEYHLCALVSFMDCWYLPLHVLLYDKSTHCILQVS
jgi:hypothetical protein